MRRVEEAARLEFAGLPANIAPAKPPAVSPPDSSSRHPRRKAELGAKMEFPLLPVLPPALLALADGTIFKGTSIGAPGETAGEVVFNTALTGYQEILTDPSYCRQIVTLTYPHSGNTGVNDEDPESPRVYAEGLIERDVPRLHSSWRARTDLGSYLRKHNIPGIADIDTRKLT